MSELAQLSAFAERIKVQKNATGGKEESSENYEKIDSVD
jgi:hypothetical protein